jgi:hypothetical protein
VGYGEPGIEMIAAMLLANELPNRWEMRQRTVANAEQSAKAR